MTVAVFWKRRTLTERFIELISKFRAFIFRGVSRANPLGAKVRAYKFVAKNRSEKFAAKERTFIFYSEE